MDLINTTSTGVYNISIGLFSEEILKEFTIGGYLEAIFPLLLFILGLFIYCFFVFKFYKLLARRDILSLDLHTHSHGLSGAVRRFAHAILYSIENIIIIPLLVIIWVLVMTILLTLLSKTHSSRTVMLTAVAIVAVVRITSYYHESLSQDVAKMIPFALLGVFLVDMSFYSIEASLMIITGLASLWKQIIYYLAIVMVLELIMRFIQIITNIFSSEE